MTCIICRTSYSVINTIFGEFLSFYPHSGMCGPCEEKWRHSPEAKAQQAAYGEYVEKLKALVAEHRTKRELPP